MRSLKTRWRNWNNKVFPTLCSVTIIVAENILDQQDKNKIKKTDLKYHGFIYFSMDVKFRISQNSNNSILVL